jgi:ActR/RegA family two-component response regulator
MPPSPDDKIREAIARIQAATQVADARAEAVGDARLRKALNHALYDDRLAEPNYLDAVSELHQACHDFLVLTMNAHNQR